MKKEKMIIIIFFMGIMALFCADVAFAAETTVNMGSITVHGPCDDPYVVCTPLSRDIKVRPTGNTITIQVAYSMSCPGSYDEGYCDISFVGGGGTDSRQTTTTDSGIMTISKFMNPGDTFTVSLHAKYTDWWGSTLLGETTKSAVGTVTVVSPPVAEFSFYPSVPTTDNTIWFNDLSTDTDDTTIVSWSWSFGDGTSSSSKNPTHQYHSSGTYTVTLEVADDYGLTSQMTHSISVKTKPISKFSYSPLAPNTDDTIYFKDKTYDYDSDGNITSWSWMVLEFWGWF
jgi:PKD repeat protein